MSLTLSHSRLFKATRRFIVIEVTLVIVIVILFAWSTYVLIRLFSGENETLFGLSIGHFPVPDIKSQQANQSNQSLALNRSQPYQSPTDLNEQLAGYKNQILKELIARQRKLMSADTDGRLASLLGIGVRGLNSRSIGALSGNKDQDETLDQEREKRRARHQAESSLIYLENAPSLMQLSSASRGSSESPDDDSPITTTSSPTFEAETDQIATTVQPASVSTLESLETTTTEPATPDDDQEETPSTTPGPSSDATQNPSDGDQETAADQENVEGKSGDDSDRAPSERAEDEKRASNAVKTIDEEVDRMTQPSLGIASRQSQPIDSSTNGVQFDDPLLSDQDRNQVLLARSRFRRATLGSEFSEAEQRQKQIAIRRSDDEGDDDTGGDDPHQPRDQASRPLVAQRLHGSIAAASQQSEPTFEQLLAHKQLLDALQQSLPPAPLKLDNSTSHSVPIAIPTIPGKSGSDDDHQSADSQFTVDHGLLMYPASDEEHHHKSKSHKSHKASKKKDKKKLTVAMKKGGHKRKKHKKEEKKYHKEKKFKGAKKGKKMKKGKGGKGGKKGKKLFKDKGYKKKGFKNTYVKNEFGSKKSYFDEFRDKDFKKKWKNFDDKYNYAQMKKWQAKDVKKAKKMKDHGEKFKKYDKGKWKKQKFADMSSGSKKSLAKHQKDF